GRRQHEALACVHLARDLVAVHATKQVAEIMRAVAEAACDPKQLARLIVEKRAIRIDEHGAASALEDRRSRCHRLTGRCRRGEDEGLTRAALVACRQLHRRDPIAVRYALRIGRWQERAQGAVALAAGPAPAGGSQDIAILVACRPELRCEIDRIRLRRLWLLYRRVLTHRPTVQ